MEQDNFMQPSIPDNLKLMCQKYQPFLKTLCCPFSHFIDFLKTLFCTFCFLLVPFFLKEQNEEKIVCHVSCVPSHMSRVTCHMSCVKFYMSHVTCHLSITIRTTTTYLPLLTPKSLVVKGGQDPKISHIMKRQKLSDCMPIEQYVF